MVSTVRPFRSNERVPNGFRIFVTSFLSVLIASASVGCRSAEFKPSTPLKLKIPPPRVGTLKYDYEFKELRQDGTRRWAIEEAGVATLELTVGEGDAFLHRVEEHPSTTSAKAFDLLTRRLAHDDTTPRTHEYGSHFDSRRRLLPNKNEGDPLLARNPVMPLLLLPKLFFLPSYAEKPVGLGDEWDDTFFIISRESTPQETKLIPIPVRFRVTEVRPGASEWTALVISYKVTYTDKSSQHDTRFSLWGSAVVDRTGVLVAKEDTAILMSTFYRTPDKNELDTVMDWYRTYKAKLKE